MILFSSAQPDGERFIVAVQRLFYFFFNDTATTEIYTLSLPDALPILPRCMAIVRSLARSMNCRSLLSGALSPSSTLHPLNVDAANVVISARRVINLLGIIDLPRIRTVPSC